MLPNWTPCTERLPANGTRVLCWVPKNSVYLPGKTGATEERNAVVLKFAEDWFIHNPSKTGRTTHRHFWLGEGTSNHFFEEVTHWMPLPEGP